MLIDSVDSDWHRNASVVLDAMCANRKGNRFGQHMEEMFEQCDVEADFEDQSLIMQLLEEHKLIRVARYGRHNGNTYWKEITIEGVLFSELGGYERYFKEKKKDARIKNVIKFLEVAGNYIP